MRFVLASRRGLELERDSFATNVRTTKMAGVRTCDGDLCCCDLRKIVKGEEARIKGPAIFMTNRPYTGVALSEKCLGQYRRNELTG